MQEIIADNYDRKKDKILELVNEKMEEEGEEVLKIDTANLHNKKKAINNITQKVFQLKNGGLKEKPNFLLSMT